ncbi:SCO6880 family protein, partial [Spirillospora sp. NPDC048819]|uniref:SCO6880 family protein n=1 Tax=Spirillospora sp. NPDC048819 TaxID=3155268 RepID=UPI0033DC9DB8
MGDNIRTYGGWRRRHGIGLLGMDTTSTFVALSAAILLVLVAATAPHLLIYLLPPALLGGGLALIRIGGVPLARLLLARCRWRWGVLRGHNRYRAGVVIDHPRAFQLPGVLAPLTLLSAEDGYGGRYG